MSPMTLTALYPTPLHSTASHDGAQQGLYSSGFIPCDSNSKSNSDRQGTGMRRKERRRKGMGGGRVGGREREEKVGKGRRKSRRK